MSKAIRCLHPTFPPPLSQGMAVLILGIEPEALKSGIPNIDGVESGAARTYGLGGKVPSSEPSPPISYGFPFSEYLLRGAPMRDRKIQP